MDPAVESRELERRAARSATRDEPTAVTIVKDSPPPRTSRGRHAAPPARDRPATPYKPRRYARPDAVPIVAGGSVEIAIAFALQQVGKPYIWGATGPGAYDCSGLLVAAYAKIGVRLPHQTEAMLRHGTPVSRSQLRRGDLVWPQPGHIAIYLGDGMIVHAANSRNGILVSKLYGFHTARRVA